MNYEKRYNNLVAAIKQLQESNPSDEGIQNWVEDNVPELCESEDDRIRNLIYCLIRDRSDNGKLLEHNGVSVEEALAWLERQWNDSYLQEKIAAFTAAHKGEDPEDIIAACRGDERQGEQKQDPCRTCDHPVLSCSAFPCEKKKQAEQKPTEWSEEDSYMLGQAIKCVNNFGKLDVSTEEIEDWLKSLKPQHKQEWSETDKSAIIVLTRMIKQSQEIDPLTYTEPLKVGLYAWLNSLKERVQPTVWKPTDEQMADLWNMVCECRPADQQLLQDIYHGLKKLKEE